MHAKYKKSGLDELKSGILSKLAQSSALMKNGVLFGPIWYNAM